MFVQWECNVRRLSVCLYSENVTGRNMRKQVTCLAVTFYSLQVGRSITYTRNHRCCVESVARTIHWLIRSDSFTAGHEQCSLLSSSAMAVWTFISEIYNVCSGLGVVSFYTFKSNVQFKNSKGHLWVAVLKFYLIIIIIIFIYCNWVVTRWQWLLYMYTKHEIGY